jgi:hypothetical protein
LNFKTPNQVFLPTANYALRCWIGAYLFLFLAIYSADCNLWQRCLFSWSLSLACILNL